MSDKVESSQTRTSPTESQEQQALITWVDTFHPKLSPFLWAVPNGGSRHPAEALRLRAEGVRPGVSDLVFSQARGRYHALFLEMKRAERKGKVVSGGQEGFFKRQQAEGYCCRLAFGTEQAKKVLEWYWSLPPYDGVTGPENVPIDPLVGLPKGGARRPSKPVFDGLLDL